MKMIIITKENVNDIDFGYDKVFKGTLIICGGAMLSLNYIEKIKGDLIIYNDSTLLAPELIEIENLTIFHDGTLIALNLESVELDLKIHDRGYIIANTKLYDDSFTDKEKEKVLRI